MLDHTEHDNKSSGNYTLLSNAPNQLTLQKHLTTPDFEQAD